MTMKWHGSGMVATVQNDVTTTTIKTLACVLMDHASVPSQVRPGQTTISHYHYPTLHFSILSLCLSSSIHTYYITHLLPGERVFSGLDNDYQLFPGNLSF